MKKRPITLEIIVLIIYVAGLVAIGHYHEPWLDEAQAWLIARDAPLTDLLTKIPHNEGHPPFWSLIQMPFAKAGFPFEPTIQTINIAIMTLAMGLFLFKAPFPKIPKLLFPFTYFMFYQYGVIARPYSLLTLGFVLAAITYKNRNEKPFEFIASITIICMAHAFGLILSGGICLTWLVEILRENSRVNLERIRTDKKLQSLTLIFALALAIIYSIIPNPNTHGTIYEQKWPPGNLEYFCLSLPADATCYSTVRSYSNAYGNSNDYAMPTALSVIIQTLLITFAYKKGKLKLCLFPLLLLGAFTSIVYFSVHHIGIMVMFYMFILWTCFEAETKATYPPLFKTTATAMTALCFTMSISWTIVASGNEILLPYGGGRETASFIKSHKMEHAKIMAGWYVEKTSTNYFRDYANHAGTDVLPYFKSNIFYNFKECYLKNAVNTNDAYVKKLRKEGPPEIIYEPVAIGPIFEMKTTLADYTLIKPFDSHWFWKDDIIPITTEIYVRTDCYTHYAQKGDLKPK